MAIFTKADYVRGVTLTSGVAKTPVDLTGWQLEMVFKANRAAEDPLLTVSTTSGGLVLDPAKPGRFIISLTAIQVNAIGAGDRALAIYRIDGGRHVRIMSGRAIIREGV